MNDTDNRERLEQVRQELVWLYGADEDCGLTRVQIANRIEVLWDEWRYLLKQTVPRG